MILRKACAISTPLVLAAAITLSSDTVLGHQAVEDRLREVNKALAQSPDDAELLLQRGKLQFEHGEYTPALQDLVMATQREDNLCEAWTIRATVESRLKQINEALNSNDRFTHCIRNSASPTMRSQANLQRGDILSAAGRPKEAAASYQQSLLPGSNSPPEVWLKATQALVDSQQPDAAIKTLERAINAYGELPQLLEQAVQIERARRNTPAALQWLDRQLKQPTRHEYIYLEKARLQHGIGDKPAAFSSLQQAQKALDALPKAHRYSQAALQVQQAIQQEQNKLNSPPEHP